MPAKLIDRLTAVRRFGYQGQAGFIGDQANNALTNQLMIVGGKNADGPESSVISSRRRLCPGASRFQYEWRRDAGTAGARTPAVAMGIGVGCSGGNVSCICVPEPVLLHTSSRPPRSSARSRIPCKPKCPAGRAAPNHLLVNALSIVAHAQPELPRVETDLQRNLPRHGVAIGITHAFVGDPIHLRGDDRLQGPRCAVDDDVNRRCIRPVRGELITNGSECPDEVIASSNSRRPCTALRATVVAPTACCNAVSSRCLASPGCSGRSPQRSVEQEQDSLKILQQRVVQITRDAGPLVETRIQGHLELSSQLPETQLPGRPQQPRQQARRRTLEPARLIHRRRNREINVASASFQTPLLLHATLGSGRARTEIRYCTWRSLTTSRQA